MPLPLEKPVCAFAEPLVLHLRAGPGCKKYPDDYRTICTLTIQCDRRGYMSAIVGPGLKADGTPARIPVADIRALIRCAQEIADRYGLTELFSIKHITDKVTGKNREHVWCVSARPLNNFLPY